MLDIHADALIGTFSKSGDLFENSKVLGVIMDVEVIRAVMLPVEFFVEDLALAVIGIIDDLAETEGDPGQEKEQGKKKSFAES